MKTKFFTGDGDTGESKISGKTVPKSVILMELLGNLDELNSWLGFIRVESEKFPLQNNVDVTDTIKTMQENIFTIQAEVAAVAFDSSISKNKKIGREKTAFLEGIIKKIDDILPRLTKFIIPGGTDLAARLDVGRTIARRAERSAKKYSSEKTLSAELLAYLNRLSSALFALARYVNYKFGIQENHPGYK